MLKYLFDQKRDHYFGDIEAQVELIEYGDFQCLHCAEVYPGIKKLQEAMGDQLKFVYRHYPLSNIHPMSLEAAVAAEVASLQNRFWHMHDIIFENQKFLSRASLKYFAEDIELDMRVFDDSRGHKKLIQKVINDFESGVKGGVNGTPTFFINGQRYNGFHDFEGLYRTCRYVTTLKAFEPK